MVSILYTQVRNGGYCSRCKKQVRIFTLDLTADEDPKLKPNPPNVHAGLCLRCWRLVGFRVLEDATIFDSELASV